MDRCVAGVYVSVLQHMETKGEGMDSASSERCIAQGATIDRAGKRGSSMNMNLTISAVGTIRRPSR